MKAALNLLVLRGSLKRSTLFLGSSLGGRYHFLLLPLLLTPVEDSPRDQGTGTPDRTRRWTRHRGRSGN